MVMLRFDILFRLPYDRWRASGRVEWQARQGLQET